MAHVKHETSTDFEALIRQHQSSIWAYLRYLGATRAESDDLTQETFLALMRSPFEDRGDGTTESTRRSFEVSVRPNSTRFEDASPDFRFATAVAGFGMLLSKTNQMGTATLDSIHKIASTALGNDSTGNRAAFAERVKDAIEQHAAEKPIK